MSFLEQKRVEVLVRLGDGRMSGSEAAVVLGKSPRQIRRMRQRFRQEGVASVGHGNRGRQACNHTPDEVVDKIVALCSERYRDFNVCHLQELLQENEGIVIGRSTLDRLLKAKGLRRRRVARRVIRKRRDRREAEGMMLQIDGSPHDWLEGRGERLCLMGAIDDATGKIVYAEFRKSEDQAGYLKMLREITVKHGLPMSLYHDRHTILCSPKALSVQEQLDGKKAMSQIQRVMDELGIESIAARSPEAKGRVERLWGTLQDRLLKEMRLAGISTREEANRFLPGFLERYNLRFGKAAAANESAWIAAGKGLDLLYYFSARQERRVNKDHTVRWEGKLLQILPRSRRCCLAGQAVYIHTTPEGEVYLYGGKKRLEYRELPAVREAASSVRPPLGREAISAEESTTSTDKHSKPSDRPGTRRWLYVPSDSQRTAEASGHAAMDIPATLLQERETELATVSER